MSRLRNHLLACAAAISLAAAAAWGAVGINDLQVTNVGTTTFTVVWTTSEVSTPGLEVFSDSGGANAVTATLSLDYYPVAEGDPTVVNDTGARAGRRALELLAISRRVVAVRVTGLVPGTAYFVRPRTFGPDGADNGASSVPLTPVTTAQFTSLVIDGRLAQVRFPAFAAEGMIAVVQGPAGTTPLSAIVGDSTAADSAVFPLAGLLDTATGTNALFNAPQSIVVRVFGLGAPAGTFTKTINFGPAFTVAKYELVEADISSPAPFITTQPVNRTVQEGTAATFTAVATGTPAPTYQWQRKPAASATWSDLGEGSTYAGVTTGTLSVNSVTPDMTGDQFRSIVSNGVVPDATSDAATLGIGALPSIASMPAPSQVVPLGGILTFGVTATGIPAPTYQWQRNGVDITGATNAAISIANAAAADAGTYRVVISNLFASVTSNPITVAVVGSDLLGLSARFAVPAGGSIAAGFVIEGSQSKTILLRGAGPALATVSVVGALADPRIVLSDSASVQLAVNDDWNSNANAEAISTTATRLGALAFANGSKDAALLVTLNPGTYSVELSGVGGLGGIALLEINDVDTDGRPRVVMLTARGPAGSGGSALTSGFVVGGTEPKTILVRALGESLGASNGVLRDPVLSVYASGNTLLDLNDDWQVGNSATVSALNAAAITAGARTLGATADSALLLTLNPGTYTAQIAGSGGTTGESFLEIFEVDAQRAASLAPAITYLSRNQAAVLGGSAVFGVNVVAKPAATYQWRKTVGAVTENISGATAPVLALNNVQNSDSGSYDVEISNGIGAAIISPARTLTVLPEFHSADSNQDRQISLLELTRVIQLYNTMNGATRTGEYHTQAGTEDGFALGPGSIAAYHSADTNRDGRIDAPELLRVIVLYNFVNGTVRTGEYHAAAGTEDGFAPGSVGPL